MIELTTGVMFLLSSMYGGATTENLGAVATANSTSINPTTVVVGKMDRKQVENYLNERYAETPILIEIARCESTFSHFDKNGKVTRGIVDSADVGVMQINERYHLETAKKLGYDIYTVEGNAAYGEYLYKKYGTEPWNASAKCWGDKALSMK